MRPPSFPIFVEAPSDLEALQEKAAHFDADYEMSYRDNGMEFRFTKRVAAIQFLAASGGRPARR
jgi:hypothetical protein